MASQELVYDPKTQSWVPATSSSAGGTVASTPASTSTTPQPSQGAQTQTNSAGKANKEQAVLEYNTLEGDMTLRASVGVLKIKQDTTIQIAGIGTYLSGMYYVSNVTYALDASSGFGMTCTLVKTGFGSSLKAPATTPVEVAVREEPVPLATSPAIKVGDSVRIVGDDATYSNASAGVKVPNWVKQKTLTVQQLSSDGTRALVQPIFSWTYLKYLQKV